MPKPIVVYDSVANELLTPAIAADSVSITESLIIDKNLTVTGSNNVVGTIVITGDATVNSNLVVTGSQTLGGVQRNTWPASGSATQALTDVLANGEKGNIPAAGQFELKDNTGANILFAVDEATGQVTKVDLAGMIGNISNPLVDLPLNQLELLPFTSGTFVSTTAATAVPNYPLRTVTLSLSGGTPIPGVVAGRFVAVSGNNYHITAVSGGDVTVEYSTDLADPVAGDAIFAIWRMAGKYAGTTSFTRASRKTYIDPLSGLLRAVPAGFPALERMANGKVGYLSEGTSTNYCLHSQDFSNAVWNKYNSTVTINTATGPDGTLSADTLTDNTANGAHAVGQLGVIPAGAQTAYAILQAGTTQYADVQVYNLTDTSVARATFDLVNGTVVSTASGTAKISPMANGFYKCEVSGTGTVVSDVYVYISNGSTVVFPGTGSGTINIWHAQGENLPFGSSVIPTTTAAVTRAEDSLSVPMAGNSFGRNASHSLMFDTDIGNNVYSSVGAGIYPVIGMYLHRRTQASNFSYTFLGAVGWPPNGPNSGIGFNSLNGRFTDVVDAASNSIRHYDDGVLVESLPYTPPTNVTIASSIQFIVNGGNSSWSGHIRNIRIYDHALTASEIAAA